MAIIGEAPWIGMPSQMDPGGERQYLNRQYADAVAAAGGIPIILPLLETHESLSALTDNLDGILLTGSNSDIEPAHYQENRLECCGSSQPLRDKMDFFLLNIALRRKIPVLAICFGIQSLNVFFGGTLIQDSPAAVDTPIKHRSLESDGGQMHEIEIVAGSVLEEMAGGLKATVNSTHHQAINLPGQGLQVIAHAYDGIIESVAKSNHRPWMLGVQWHPEKNWDRDKISRNIFDAFLAQCRAQQVIHERTDT
jgi:putative glutamine amidotransferase